ncbi:MAG TPA: ATP-binding protein [Methylomirabilota bacterium]|nr:ATP-binding protein [Methylomirabilota bacterium]
MKTFDWGEFLRHDSFLSTQEEKTRQWLVTDEASSEHTYEPGTLIIREGEPGDSIFVIGSGSADALLSVDGDQDILLSVMRRGETFGEMGFFERRPRSATVRARETCVVLEIKREALLSLAEAHPEIGFKILLHVTERLRSKNEQILTLHLKSVEAANRAKDEFVAMLGHELRNPLGAITTAIHVLDTRGKSDDTSAPLRGIIVRQTRHLSRLVEDLLDVSKLVSGKMGLHTQPEYLRDVVARALASFHEAGKASQHVISVSGAGVRVQGDATRLQQVITNLLDNAVKYTPPGGRVDVTVAADGPDAVLTVRDTGVGIHQDLLPLIFDLFVQGSHTVARSAGGLGLGLTIVKRLVVLHGGTVSASSPGPNHGSEFVVRLPRIPDAAVEAEPIAAGVTASRARHILIIEDNADFREGLRLLLESWGHRVEEASGGAQGLELVRLKPPEVVLIDLGLPGIDGYEVARAVRSAPGGDALLLVAITGYGRASDRRRAQEAGFDAHLTKPVSPPELAAILLSKG